ncbi:MAG: hypothetical protein ACREUZ_19745 [Burkholderiales bacterium]
MKLQLVQREHREDKGIARDPLTKAQRRVAEHVQETVQRLAMELKHKIQQLARRRSYGRVG